MNEMVVGGTSESVTTGTREHTASVMFWKTNCGHAKGQIVAWGFRSACAGFLSFFARSGADGNRNKGSILPGHHAVGEWPLFAHCSRL
jgi:hypothetical protein